MSLRWLAVGLLVERYVTKPEPTPPDALLRWRIATTSRTFADLFSPAVGYTRRMSWESYQAAVMALEEEEEA